MIGHEMRQVRISELKAHLSQCLAEVRRGDVIVVLDRDTPVAQVVPVKEPTLAIRPASPAAGRRAPAAVPPRTAVSAADLIRSVRGSR